MNKLNDYTTRAIDFIHKQKPHWNAVILRNRISRYWREMCDASDRTSAYTDRFGRPITEREVKASQVILATAIYMRVNGCKNVDDILAGLCDKGGAGLEKELK